MLRFFVTLGAPALNCRNGISALEYAILAGVLLGLVSAGITTFGRNISALFNSEGAAMTTAANKAN